MWGSLIQKICILSGLLLSGYGLHGQDIAALQMEVVKEPDTEIPNLITAVVALQNTGEKDFNGTLQIETPEGFRSISGYTIAVAIPAGEKRFVPV